MKQLTIKFNHISLDELNNKAALLERTDSKYVLNAQQLEKLLIFTKPNFDLLSINNLTEFSYRSIYFDSQELDTFKHHNQGRRNRIKVRRRIYLDGGGEYFEVKLKGLRDKTYKYRLKISPQQAESPNLSAEEWFFLQKKHQKHYQRPWPEQLKPSINVDYKRTTLVAKQGSKRLTIDANLEFFDNLKHKKMPIDRFIVEVKSASARAPLNMWLTSQGIRPVKRCAKYSMGISLLQYPFNNRFRPVIKQHFLTEEYGYIKA